MATPLLLSQTCTSIWSPKGSITRPAYRRTRSCKSRLAICSSGQWGDARITFNGSTAASGTRKQVGTILAEFVKAEWNHGELFPRFGFVVTNRRYTSKNVVGLFDQRGTCEQRTKEGKGAVKWTRLSCRSIDANAVPLQLHAWRTILETFFARSAMTEQIREWSLTSFREKSIKIGAKVVSHGRYVVFRMAEVAISRHPFADILALIATLRAPPIPATAPRALEADCTGKSTWDLFWRCLRGFRSLADRRGRHFVPQPPVRLTYGPQAAGTTRRLETEGL